ncbi:MAG: HNH endonuclease [Pseudomonadota bacterium]|nr:HNH endonuclease [Pseudomonadota bacterium]
MESYNICFMTEGDGFGINLQPANEETGTVYLELLACFGDIKDNTSKVSTEQKVTEDLKQKVSDFVVKYASSHPILNRLKSKIENLSTNEYFLVLPSIPTDTSEKLKLETYISTLNEFGNTEEVQSNFEAKMRVLDEFPGDLISKYNLNIPRNDRRTIIGNAKKESRCCRFCNKTLSEGATFTKVAHAIPEGLGNKNIILGDECDDCNEFFGNDIEPSLIEHLDIYRVFLGVKGKSGTPKIKYKNGHMQVENNMPIVASQNIGRVSDKEIKVHLDSTKRFTPAKLYKALCKITLSTIDEEHVADLKQTITWMKTDDQKELCLPNVAVNVVHSGFSKVPKIVNYVRKIDDSDIPHVVSEFRLGSLVYVYIIPFSEKDNVDFSNDEYYQKFWNTFKHYSLVSGWRFDCLNSINEVSINETIRLVEAEKA